MMTTGSAGTAVRLAAVGTAVPAYTIDQQAAFGRLAGRYRGALNPHVARAMEKIFAHPSIRQRHFAVEDPDRVFGEDPDRRIERFREQAVALGCRAGREALERAGCAPRDVRALVVNTCTGYLCPGLSSYLVEALALRRDMPAFDLVGAGCGGAVPNLVAAFIPCGEPGPHYQQGTSVRTGVGGRQHRQRQYDDGACKASARKNRGRPFRSPAACNSQGAGL
jgi:predicted naringenin-chalcone synthase